MTTDWRFYVYEHRRADTGVVFYVGKGAHRTRSATRTFERAKATFKRNAHWKAIVAKHGLIVEIVAVCATDEAAQDLEKTRILEYGRIALANMTDGGDGSAGRAVSDELRRKRSVNSSGPRTEAWVAAVRLARKNGGNGGVVKRGDRLPQSWRDAIAAGKMGEKNPMHGRTGEAHPNRRSVVDTATGATFPTITAAAKVLGIRMQTLHNMLTGFRVNNTTMRFS